MGARPSGPVVRKTVEYERREGGGEGPVRACLFCSIVGGRAPATRLYMDCVCCAFLTRRPDAAKHVLVVPRRHVRNLGDVGPDDAALVSHLKHVGSAVLDRMSLSAAAAGPVAADDSLVPVPAELATRERELAKEHTCDDCTAAQSSTLLSPPADAVPVSAAAPDDERDDRVFAFHAPPYNSVDHLHLHCMAPPFTGWKGSWSHWTGGYWSPSADSIVAGLEAGKARA
ncbi:hypothetical protein FNF29_01979 [Cafeteria roenbergensis]|uniref:HIT domain-containing protein n=1 Tax=Cafeteria roenbergensis TaxID=33653 RepID=A0A5A8CR78_CAFRO|nr:hypothetical protein FNF29_01979 [Cafeteria roenbergensis]|eukprot:KAA0155228.1 hypothetical protein FNF29_01979 [Cafeteria roenbergensis]